MEASFEFFLYYCFFPTFWGASKAICACLVSTFVVVVIVAVLRARFVLSPNINISFMAITHTPRTDLMIDTI